MGYIRGLHAWLAERRCRLLVLLVPNKATLFREKLADVRPRVRVVYDDVFAALAATGDGTQGAPDLWLVDPRPVLGAGGDTPTYVPTDTHWTPEAARGVAGLVAAAIDAQLYTLAVIGVLTSVVGAFYYLRIVKLMYFDEPAEAFDRAVGFELRLIIAATSIAMIVIPVAIGPIVTSAGESAAEKVEILREAGVGIIVRPSEFGNAVAEALAKLD